MRSFAVLWAIGAKPRHLAAFIWSEGLIVVLSGALVGIGTGFLVAYVLVKLLTGVFDPPPETLSIAWAYLLGLLAAGLVAAIAAIIHAHSTVRRSPLAMLREL